MEPAMGRAGIWRVDSGLNHNTQFSQLQEGGSNVVFTVGEAEVPKNIITHLTLKETVGLE